MSKTHATTDKPGKQKANRTFATSRHNGVAKKRSSARARGKTSTSVRSHLYLEDVLEEVLEEELVVEVRTLFGSPPDSTTCSIFFRVAVSAIA